MKRLIGLALFVTVASIAWWSTMDFFGEDDLTQPAHAKHYIEIFMDKFELTAMSKNGTPAYILNGTRYEQYNDSDDAIVTQPVIFFLNTDKQWKISADLALVNNKKETVLLKDNVLMQQQNIEPSITVHTQRLLIDTRSQIAQTELPVDITRGNSHLTSVGMIYNNISSELEFLSNVSGYFTP
ncbi:MAG: LPS export ABC transporter periplasmic protein LptC [Gammaproteobacteria bacterium]|nr:LPS export ABC transporter periplasmic protein LptC [Gammaproteobacteria bacterium]